MEFGRSPKKRPSNSMWETLALGGLGYLGYRNDWLGSVGDYFSGYTSANSANRFYQENLALQQKYIEENMAKQQEYNLENMATTDRYQRSLISDSPALQVQALRSAGLNPLLAVDNGISSPSSSVHSANPSPVGPSASSPAVNPKYGDVLGAVGSAFSFGNDFMRLLNESKIADAQIRNLDSDTALKSAKALTEPSVKSHTDASTIKTKVNAITDAVGAAAPIVGSAASAYAAKKSAEVAKEGVKRGMTSESAKKLASDLVGVKPSTSAVSTASLFGKVLSLFLPAGLAAGGGALMYKAQNDAMKKGRTSFTSHMSAGW